MIVQGKDNVWSRLMHLVAEAGNANTGIASWQELHQDYGLVKVTRGPSVGMVISLHDTVDGSSPAYYSLLAESESRWSKFFDENMQIVPELRDNFFRQLESTVNPHGEREVQITEDFEQLDLGVIDSLLYKYSTLDKLLVALRQRLSELESSEVGYLTHPDTAINEKNQLERNIATVKRWQQQQEEWIAKTAGHPELIYPPFSDGSPFVEEMWMDGIKDVESVFLLWLAINADVVGLAEMDVEELV